MVTKLENKPAAMSTSDTGRGSYSLLLLFYMTTMAAITVAASRLALDNELFTWRTFALGCVIVAVVSSFVGSLVGYLCARGAKGLIVGLVISLCLSPFAAWIALVRATHFSSACAIIFTGCWLVIALAAAGNRFQSKPRALRDSV